MSSFEGNNNVDIGKLQQEAFEEAIKQYKQKVKSVLCKFHGGLHPKCNICKIEKELGLDKE